MSSLEPACPWAGELPAYLQGELDPPAAAAVAGHLAGCAACREELECLGRLLAHFRDLPPTPLPRDLTPRVLAEARRGRGPLAIAGMAAAALLLVLIPTSEGPAPAPVAAQTAGASWPDAACIRSGVDWLVRAQESDGSWSAMRHGGRAPYDVGVTGLAMMALVDSGCGDAPVLRALDRGAAFLVRQQEASGRFGPPITAHLYNHGPATVALLKVHGAHSWPGLRAAVAKAVAHVVATQDSGGGWGYETPPRGRTNLVISGWPLEALVLAREQGYPRLDAAIGAAQTWIRSLADADGLMGYSRPGVWPYGPMTPTAIGAWCLARAGGAAAGRLAVAGADDLLGLYYAAAVDRQAAGPALERLTGLQVQRGPQRGSWPPPVDAWGGEGGRVYCTSMGVLAAVAAAR